MELKVVCYCGQKYKFDVEPVDGRMPFTVNCPVCNVDGTPLANQLLREQLSGIPQPAPLITAPLVAPPPIPVPAVAAHIAAAPAIVPPLTAAPAAAGGGVRITMSAPAPLPLPAASAPPLSAPAPTAMPRPITPVKAVAAPKVQSKEFRMGMGIFGAFLGAAVGGGLVYAFCYFTPYKFPATGTVIGVFAGLGARLLARGTDSTLGFIAAAFALGSVAGTFFLIYGEFPILAYVAAGFTVYFAYRFAS